MCLNKVFTQNYYEIKSSLHPDSNYMDLEQKIIFHNNSENKLNHLILYDWNNAYSSNDTPLSKKLYEEYNLALIKSDKKERGFTIINKITTSFSNLSWERTTENPDLIKIFLKNELEKNQKIEVDINYRLVFPNSKMNDYGYSSNRAYTIKNFLLRVTPFVNGSFERDSNLNFDDQFNTSDDISMDVTIPLKYIFHSNCIDSQNIVSDRKIINLNCSKLKDLSFFIYKNNEFEMIKNEHFNIVTNEKKIVSIKNESFKRINTFLSENFDNYSNSKILLTKRYFKEHSLYPYSDIPSYLKVFNQNTINEINLFKVILRDFLRNSINFNDRKYYWVRSGMEFYYLEKYIQKYHTDSELIGSLSNIFLIKNHQISNKKMSEIFNISQLYIKRLRLDQKISEPSNNLTRINYRLVNPAKSLNAFKLLELYDEDLIHKTFKILLNDQLLFKNNDQLKDVFKRNTSENLDWFFDHFINFSELLDYKIEINKNKVSILDKSKEKIQIPIPIKKVFKNDSIFNFLHLNYKDDIDLTYENDLKKIIIDPDNLLVDINSKNNYINFDSKRKKTKLRFYTDIESKTENQIYYRPQLGYNFYDGLLPGLTFTNRSPISKPFTFMLSPYFGLKKNKLTGAVSFSYRDFIKKNISLNYFLSASSFHYDENFRYKKFTPSVLYLKRDSDIKSNKFTSLRFRYYFIDRPDISQNERINNVYSLSFTKANPGAKKTKSFNYNIQFSGDFIKNSITLYYRNYFSDYKQFSIRIFGGKFLKNNTSNDQINFNIHKSSDFLLNNSLLARSESSGFLSQQYVRQDGAFKSRISPDYANDFLLVLNTGITIWKWVEFYGDIGLFKNKNVSLQNGYDMGLRLNFIEDYLELYLPIQSSRGFHPNTPNYLKDIRFVLTLDYQNLARLFTRRWF